MQGLENVNKTITFKNSTGKWKFHVISWGVTVSLYKVPKYNSMNGTYLRFPFFPVGISALLSDSVFEEIKRLDKIVSMLDSSFDFTFSVSLPSIHPIFSFDVINPEFLMQNRQTRARYSSDYPQISYNRQ